MTNNTPTAAIKSFRSKKYFFLSNFAPSPVTYNGILFATVEHAFQAAKSLDVEDQKLCSLARTPQDAKHFGRRVKLRPDWEEVKESVMEDLLRQKFSDSELRKQLLDTGNAELIEGNTWGDKYWGVCGGEGQNRLGYLLMKVRKEIQSENKGEKNMTNITPAFTFDTIHTPEEIVDLMFENTKDGILYMPGFPYDDWDESRYIYKCYMDWSKKDRSTVLQELTAILNDAEMMQYNSDGAFADEIGCRITRYYALKNAPKTIVDNEVQLLTAAYVLNSFATDVEVVM